MRRLGAVFTGGGYDVYRDREAALGHFSHVSGLDGNRLHYAFPQGEEEAFLEARRDYAVSRQLLFGGCGVAVTGIGIQTAPHFMTTAVERQGRLPAEGMNTGHDPAADFSLAYVFYVGAFLLWFLAEKKQSGVEESVKARYARNVAALTHGR